MTRQERLIQAAALVIRQDAKLLGIPVLRKTLIPTAVEIAVGRRGMPGPGAFAEATHPENIPAILDALKRAVEAVRAEQRRLPKAA
ncbi:hypothetical protein [uncultured Methylobacterium sp.]|uniref:hypothetical protein n=1 Tax=uncultured Methylobacterium sp. TaxID=157278 RepID=UPI002626376D|nr:hypothetical protein [uncultured Methylobacterium sp.]